MIAERARASALPEAVSERRSLRLLVIRTLNFVTNFAQLAMARIAAGVGEAGCMPPTYSLVGDYFPGPSERTRAMTTYGGCARPG